jgi:cytochrome oxidase Cu insertion factor (SCO1/SenC/PrrC family)
MFRRQSLTFFYCISTLVSILFAMNTAFAAAVVGQTAPEISLTDTSGKTVRLSDFKGKHVVLEWNNPGCPFVRKHYSTANMQTLQKEAAGKGVVWLAVNSTEKMHTDYMTPQVLGKWMVEQKASPTATLMDESGDVGKAYGARTTPHMYVVNPQGILVYAGGIDSIPSANVDDIKTATNYVRQTMNEVVAGKAVSTPTTRPYGCSVKYKS